MRFLACLKKDLRLLTGGGIRSILFLLLPLLLALIMTLSMSGVASASVRLQSFDIAVRDEDDTIMSRLLISQLENVKLFERVIRLKEGEQPPENGRCAACVTIPKDFFYDLYEMKDTDVVISLNEDMPNEAGMVRSAFTSLIGILEENQRIYYAASRVRYGELDSERTRELYEAYSSASAEDALNRLSFFELSGVYQKGFDSKKLFFGASIISMLMMFIPLAGLRSISEETGSGLLDRFRTAGGSAWMAVLSKLVIAFVMTFVPALAAAWLLGLGNIAQLIPTLIVCFLLSFSFFLFVCSLAGRPQTAQLVGNVIMLIMLTLGGALFPYELLPAPLKSVSDLMLPRIILRAMERPYLGRGSAETLAGLIPLLIAAACLFIAALPFMRKRRRA